MWTVGHSGVTVQSPLPVCFLFFFKKKGLNKILINKTKDKKKNVINKKKSETLHFASKMYLESLFSFLFWFSTCYPQEVWQQGALYTIKNMLPSPMRTMGQTPVILTTRSRSDIIHMKEM